MNPLPPIPTPPALRWREFRIKVIPGLVFGSVLLTVLMIWTTSVTPTNWVGQVEGAQANVTSAKAGMLTQLQVDRFVAVRAGDPIAVVVSTDPKVIESSLAVIRAEVELLRLSMSPSLDRERNQLAFERLRMDWLEQRVLLASAQVRSQYADSEFQRVAELYQSSSNIVSKAAYDIALRDRDVSLAETAERAKVTQALAESLQKLETSNPTNAPTADATLRAAIAVEDAKLQLTEAQLKPISLLAPISGMVSTVFRRAGENIVAGEPVLTITSDQPERIVAYLRQPLTIEPKAGMPVRVVPRTIKRVSGTAEVRQVMASMQPIPPALLGQLALQTKTVELGLPIDISLPAGLKLRNGEIVDGSFLRPN